VAAAVEQTVLQVVEVVQVDIENLVIYPYRVDQLWELQQLEQVVLVDLDLEAHLMKGQMEEILH
jgi:hypothetical protein|tara:strand:+ start:132 stop:323 length:192 start_codon:yes stop_codon:yes gene_type:complete